MNKQTLQYAALSVAESALRLAIIDEMASGAVV